MPIERDSQHDIDERTLAVLARKPERTRLALLEQDSLECAHDRDRLSGATDRNTRAIERVAEALEGQARKPARAWTARDYAVVIGGVGVLVAALGPALAQILKALGK